MGILQENKDVRARIEEHRAGLGISYAFLARKAGCSINHLSQVLKCNRALTDEILGKLNEALKTDFKKEDTIPMKAAS